jgi:hypothetical protein
MSTISKKKMQPSTWPPIDFTMDEATQLSESTSTRRLAIYSGSTTPPPHTEESQPTQAEPPASFHNTPPLKYPRTHTPRQDSLRESGGVGLQSPPTVIRGANCQNATEGPSVSVDWLRFSGPRAMLFQALPLLQQFFGEAEPGKGRFFKNSGYHFATGGIFYDDNSDSTSKICVELPSTLLGQLQDPAMIQQLSRELYFMGFKAIRADIAIDFFDQPDLIETVLKSCEEGLLTGSKTFNLMYGKSSGKHTGKTLNIGKRGKEGSGRFLRIYDKGLETKTRKPGDWIRWEAELSDDCSAQFVQAFIDSDDQNKPSIEHAFGVCDFREEPEKRLSRRPRCAWFTTLLGSITPKRVRARRSTPNIYSKVRWLQTCVAPTLRTIQAVTGRTVDQVLHQITGEVKPKHDKLNDTLVREVCSTFGVPSHELQNQYTRRAVLCHG